MPTIVDQDGATAAVRSTSHASAASASNPAEGDTRHASSDDPPPRGASLADRLHAGCVVCSRKNPRSLRLCFGPTPDGEGVTASFPCDTDFQGYDGLIHGGVVSMLLDGAMAHCLFHHGRAGHTGELVVRFRQGVLVGRVATVSARLVRSKGRMHELSAELRQDRVVKAEATARFMEARSTAR